MTSGLGSVNTGWYGGWPGWWLDVVTGSVKFLQSWRGERSDREISWPLHHRDTGTGTGTGTGPVITINIKHPALAWISHPVKLFGTLLC